MRFDQVKPALFVMRGPFDPCAPGGCNGRNTNDGLLHEPGSTFMRSIVRYRDEIAAAQ